MLQVEKKNYIVAIDLGSQNVTAAAATRAADGKMVVEAVVRKPSGGVAGGAIENIEMAVKSLKEVVNELGEQLNIRVLEAYFGISGDFIRCACHNDWVSVGDHNNGVSQSDVDELYARMEKVSAPTDDELILERIPQNFVVDGNKEVANPVGSFGQSLSSTFNFILSTKTPIERLKKAAINLGIRPLGIYINPLVTAETLLSADEKEEGVAVIDMGSNVTDVTIYYNNVIRYVASIPMGANTINLDIRAQSIPEKVVEKIKVRFGSAVAANVDEGVMIDYRTPKGKKGILQRNLATVIQARVQDMADMVVEEIKFAGYEKKLPYGIVLTGGGANLADIAEAFTEQTKIDTRIGVPDVVVDEQSADLVDGPEFATVVGLLWRGMESGVACNFDLRPQAPRPVQPAPQPVQPKPVMPTPAPMSQPVQPKPAPAPAPAPQQPVQTKPAPAPAPAPQPTPAPAPVQQPVEDEQYNSQDQSQEQSAEQSSGKKGGLLGKLTKFGQDLINKIGTMSESDDDII